MLRKITAQWQKQKKTYQIPYEHPFHKILAPLTIIIAFKNFKIKLKNQS